uniref:chitinase n=2 Tax=Ixodes scapularis TaxID=6945 RepID=A0A1S4KVH5_IXOSC
MTPGFCYRFSHMVSDRSQRQKFVRSAVKFCREHGFDGLDLDWEYPSFRDGGKPEDKTGYAQLIKELREAFESEPVPRGKQRLLLSVAMPAGKEYIDNGFDVKTIAKAADFLNLLTYDYHTAYESATQHHAPLGPLDGLEDWDEDNRLNVRWTVDYYLKLGAPKNKLIVGVPTYGRSYTLEDLDDTELEAPAEGPGEPGNSTREKGYLAYYEICQNVNEHGWELERPHPKRMGPYAFKDSQWVGFDDEEMLREKASYILSKGLGGVMIWTLDNDDFRGNCGGEQSPLITALRKALLSKAIQTSGSNHQTRALLRPSEDDEEYEDDEPSTTAASTKRRGNTGGQRRISKASSSLSPGRGSSLRRGSNAALSVTTPPPPPTPDPGPAFECEDEGFFNNPKDCRKYFWCLDSGPANLGIVAHAFTCPSGLYFNSRSESCDYKDNVACKQPPPTSTTRRTTTTTTTTTTRRPSRRPHRRPAAAHRRPVVVAPVP